MLFIRPEINEVVIKNTIKVIHLLLPPNLYKKSAKTSRKPVLTREQFNKLSSEEKDNYIQISRPKKRQMPKTVKPLFPIRKEPPVREPPKKRHKPS